MDENYVEKLEEIVNKVVSFLSFQACSEHAMVNSVSPSIFSSKLWKSVQDDSDDSFGGGELRPKSKREQHQEK